MKTYGSSVRVISGRGRLALALMAALVAALLLGIGLPGGERALATGDGGVGEEGETGCRQDPSPLQAFRAGQEVLQVRQADEQAHGHDRQASTDQHAEPALLHPV